MNFIIFMIINMRIFQFRFYVSFVWTVSLISIILILSSTQICRVRQPNNGENSMVNAGSRGIRTRYLGGDLRKQGDELYPERVLSDTRQNSLLSNTQDRNIGDIDSSKIGGNKELRMCIATPRHLKGRMNISQHVKVEDVRDQQVLENVKYGGVYRPTDCKTSESVAIIIPYRDRNEHLEILVNHLHTMLQRQKLHYGIYVVEMSLPVQFNRGLLANAGFMISKSIGNYTCYIIHDVDLLPINDFNTYKCGNEPRHLVARNSKFDLGELPYEGYIGGVLALSKEQYLKINGFSNLFFGWGGEDDDMYRRITASNLTLERVSKDIGIYMALPHDADTSNPSNPYRQALVAQAETRMLNDGLSSLQYHRKSTEFRQLYTLILIECVESEVMKDYAHLRVNAEFVVKYARKHKKKTTRMTVKKILKRKGL